MEQMPNVFEKKGSILFVQADHLSGEVIGTAIDDLYRAGACNVQVIPSITKKNRPGYLFFIDVCPEHCGRVESVIVNELGATGWHHLESGHRHVATEIVEREVRIETPEGPFPYMVKVKRIKMQPHRMRPEHASCLALRGALRERGVEIPLGELYTAITRQLEKQ